MHLARTKQNSHLLLFPDFLVSLFVSSHHNSRKYCFQGSPNFSTMLHFAIFCIHKTHFPLFLSHCPVFLFLLDLSIDKMLYLLSPTTPLVILYSVRNYILEMHLLLLQLNSHLTSLSTNYCIHKMHFPLSL